MRKGFFFIVLSLLVGLTGLSAQNNQATVHLKGKVLDSTQGAMAGATVKVWNERGEVILLLKLTDAVPPGVVASEKGAWLSTSRTGQTISALVSADMRADLAEGACFNDTRVEVSAA